ncbi:SDR family oxidoreductase [Sphingomonas sp. TX0543]|uniref:SDR family oxidoreductase n=1 Tax=unclassified Sphingomonas TaxID=196159 RepID=UPI0010F9DB28|nr:SDR family oxidoreductase [Sphingomonas sp. 3P27F8]
MRGDRGPENIGAAFTANPADAAFRGQKAALGRLRRPKDIADVIASLMSDAARFITGGGIMADGAAMAAP